MGGLCWVQADDHHNVHIHALTITHTLTCSNLTTIIAHFYPFTVTLRIQLDPIIPSFIVEGQLEVEGEGYLSSNSCSIPCAAHLGESLSPAYKCGTLGACRKDHVPGQGK